MKNFILFPLFMAAFLFTGCGPKSSSSEEGVIPARFASEEIEGDFMTVWGKSFADHMREHTEGKLDIEVYPYGSLGATRDINELAQLGVVQFVFSDYAWISSFVPEAQVLALHYVWPRENTAAVLEWVVNNGAFMPELEKAFRQKNLVPLSIMYEGWQWVTSKKPSATLEDLQGQKIRLMGSKLLVENYRSYGISPTPMSYGEVYSSLQTGVIDAQVNPLFADYSMKFYEVTDHFTQMWAEPFLGIPAVNRKFFDSRPAEEQQAMKDYFRNHIVEAAEWIDARNEADRKKIEQERPEITWTEWSEAQIEIARGRVAPVRRDVYPGLVGDNAQRLLDLLLKDIEAAQSALETK
ncbi:TRAP transporter substrate-binding protein DctP [Kiritimatiellaeota bacterium B1221]|nr:TRAP transporter substrate-binding protein DctP [Kiritimatiellaeota bacterium B1221]